MSGQETAFIQKNKGIISLFIDCGMRKMLQLSIIITRTGKRFSMDIGNLWSLQLMMFLLMACRCGDGPNRGGGEKRKIKGNWTDLMLDLFLPCNIINFFPDAIRKKKFWKNGLWYWRSPSWFKWSVTCGAKIFFTQNAGDPASGAVPDYPSNRGFFGASRGRAVCTEQWGWL